MPPVGVSNYVISQHALFEMERRALDEDLIRGVLLSPEQRDEVRAGRIVLQSRVSMGDPAKRYVVRIFVDIDRDPAEVVTVYRTSRISKYWREES